MDQAWKDRLAVNLSNLPKKASTAATTIVAGLIAYWESLPQKCDLTADPTCTVSHASILAHLPVSAATLAMLTILGPILVAAVWPQFNLKPQADARPVAPAAPLSGSSVDFPLPTGHAPLPTLPPHDS